MELVRKLELTPYRVVEVGVHHYARRHGRSQFFRMRSLLITLYQLMRLYAHVGWMSSKTKAKRTMAWLFQAQ